jgi:diphthamide synthase subunit DPH2
MIIYIKQLLDARVINFVQQTLTSSVTHETIDRLLRKIANHKIMILELYSEAISTTAFQNKMHWCNKSVSKL